MPTKAFTLIELVIYIGIAAFVLVALLSLGWVLINDQIKQERLAEVNDNGLFVLDKTRYYATRADTVNGLTVYNSHPGKLVLDYVTNPQITFDTYQKTITLGGNPVTVTKIRIKEGVNPAVDLTSDTINVSNFTLTNLTTAGAVTVRVNLTLQSVNPSNTQAYAAQNNWTTSVTIRKK